MQTRFLLSILPFRTRLQLDSNTWFPLLLRPVTLESTLCSLLTVEKPQHILQEIKGFFFAFKAFSPQVKSVIHSFKMSPLQTEAMNVQNCFISRHTPQVYNHSLSPLLLYHSHHPRNKDSCQADIITIFTNICYRPISVLLLLPLSFCMYELVLISPRKVHAWINVSESNRLN